MKELCDASQTANFSIIGFMDPTYAFCLPMFGTMITRMHSAGDSGLLCVCVCVCVCVCMLGFFKFVFCLFLERTKVRMPHGYGTLCCKLF